MANDTRDLEPLEVDCLACFAPAGAVCTAPTDTGRRDVGYYHSSRVDLARELNEKPRHWMAVAQENDAAHEVNAPVEWLVDRPDQGAVFFTDEAEARKCAQDTLGALYEIQMIADYREQEN